MSVNVRSIPAIREFRGAVQRFLEAAEAVLQALQMELQRSFDWIDHEQPHYWQAQLRRAFDLVAQTRVALTTCQMRTVAGRQPSCIEEKQAHEAAKRRLQRCQEQIEATKRWGLKLHNESDEFRGRLAALRRFLDHEMPQLLALLERSATILESYAETISQSEEPPAEG